jgi:tetratricopeptide (TPR) repeat protein
MLRISIFKTIFFWVFVCVTISQAQEARSSAQDIELKIWFDKEEYLVKEPVVLHGSLKNNRDTTIYFWADDLYSLTLKDTTGKLYPRKVYTKGWGPKPTHSLKPGEVYRFDGDILFTYTMYEGLPVGTYFCVMTLRQYLGEGITSDTVRFVVKEPTGYEKSAQKLFIDAERLSWGQKKSDQAFVMYQQLIDRYPTSVYVPGALYEAALCYLYSDSKEKKLKSVAIYRKLVENYPDFLSLDHYFGSIYVIYLTMKDKEGAIKTMKELIEKHPDTKISEEAEKRLKQIEKWEFK